MDVEVLEPERLVEISSSKWRDVEAGARRRWGAGEEFRSQGSGELMTRGDGAGEVMR
jgi:hypothetical protein